MKSHYELLGISRSATRDEVRHAFRHQISLYHPDKVQHLAKELQDLASAHASALTQAYSTLIDEARRAEYDERLRVILAGGAVGAATPASEEPARGASVRVPPNPPYSDSEADEVRRRREIEFELKRQEERLKRDLERAAPQAREAEQSRWRTAQNAGHASARNPGGDSRMSAEFLRKATIARLSAAIDEALGPVQTMTLRGFDVAYVYRPRRTLLGRSATPLTILARLVPRVDVAVVQETWPLAVRLAGDPGMTRCVFVLGLEVAPARELGSAIAEQRRKQPAKTSRVVLVPVNMNDWTTLVPADAPADLKRVLDRIQQCRS